jgi:hypothetical protein
LIVAAAREGEQRSISGVTRKWSCATWRSTRWRRWSGWARSTSASASHRVVTSERAHEVSLLMHPERSLSPAAQQVRDLMLAHRHEVSGG